MQPRILIASTTWWAMPARIASAFAKVGAHVSGVVPRGSPIATVRLLKENCRYSARRPLQSLIRAINAAQPDLIIPCDDRVVEHLHELHALSRVSPVSGVRDLIERSLGPPEGYAFTSKRATLLELARTLGIAIPETKTLQTVEALWDFVGEHGFPVVLKVDGTWGGTGVRVVHSAEEADRAFAELTRPLSRLTMLQHICNHDFFPFFSKVDRRENPITAQAYVEGRTANIMLVCWEGKVLDTLSVETLFAVEQLGSSTIVRTIMNPEMELAGRLLVENLAISGFCGLDFIIESKSGKAFLIELNPRATQNGHLEPGGRASLVDILYKKLSGDEPVASAFQEETIAFFPHILRCDPADSLPKSSEIVRDVPWDEPELIRELMRKPWNSRHVLSFLYSVGFKLVDESAGLIRRYKTLRWTKHSRT